IIGDPLDGLAQLTRFTDEQGAAPREHAAASRLRSGQRDRRGHRDDDHQHADGDGTAVQPHLPPPVGRIVPAPIELHHQRIEPAPHVGDLVAELAHPNIRAIATLDYASRSLAHCTSSFMVLRVTASGALTRRCQPTSPSTTPISTSTAATMSAASQPGITSLTPNTPPTTTLLTANTPTTPPP